MKGKTTQDTSLEDFLNDAFGTPEGEENPQLKKGKKKIAPIHKDSWTIIDALNVINQELPDSQLGDKLLARCAEAFDYLNATTGLNAVQCVAVAMLVENGQSLSLREMAERLGLSCLSMMSRKADIEGLCKARWAKHIELGFSGTTSVEYVLASGVTEALADNVPFQPEDMCCKDTQELVERLATHLMVAVNDDDVVFKDEIEWIREMLEANKALPVCREALTLGSDKSMALLMLVVADYGAHTTLENEGIGPHEVKLVYPIKTTRNFNTIVNQMRSGTHELFRRGLIEHKCEDGMANVNCYVGTARLKDELLADYHMTKHTRVMRSAHMNGMVSCADITPKDLFYNAREGAQVARLRTLLTQEQLPQVQERLKQKGMRTGVCVLMHGAPGTGKTATAYELARQTGRDIIQVQVTDFLDKYVGESEGKLKKIFADYRTCCRMAKSTPILLLNEGDAILSKRTANVEKSVDQMANALQNILLEEMENLEGIMIVTTNMTMNLDKAFERRFIFKIQFDKPSREVKARIWQSMIEELDDSASQELAETYDISGGEIENIARKTIMEYAMTGTPPSLAMIKDFASEERLASTTRTAIGFNTPSTTY